jgi:hypothetical protein
VLEPPVHRQPLLERKAVKCAAARLQQQLERAPLRERVPAAAFHAFLPRHSTRPCRGIPRGLAAAFYGTERRARLWSHGSRGHREGHHRCALRGTRDSGYGSTYTAKVGFPHAPLTNWDSHFAAEAGVGACLRGIDVIARRHAAEVARAGEHALPQLGVRHEVGRHLPGVPT